MADNTVRGRGPVHCICTFCITVLVRTYVQYVLVAIPVRTVYCQYGPSVLVPVATRLPVLVQYVRTGIAQYVRTGTRTVSV